MSDLPQITSTLPPRKRAKTQEEKEQRRIERILRNRRAAHASREKKRKHVEFLENSVHKLENNIKSYKAKESKLIQLSEKLLAKVKTLGGDVSDFDLSVLHEDPIPDVELDQPMFDSIKSNSRASTPVSDAYMGVNIADDELNIDSIGSDNATNDSITTDDPATTFISHSLSLESTVTADSLETVPSVDSSNSAPISANVAATSTPSISTPDDVNTIKSKKPKAFAKKSKIQAVKTEEIESPIPTSPLSTPLLKHEYISPFKSASDSNSLVQSPGYMSSTLDITTNDYMSSNSSSFSGESRSSPVSSADSSPDSSDTNLSVDEYLSNLTNPLFLPTDYDNNTNVKSEFSNFFNFNDKVAVPSSTYLGEPFEEDHSQNASSRLHNPAAVYYDFAF